MVNMRELQLFLLTFLVGSPLFSDAFRLSLIHTNDVHAHFDQSNDKGGKCKKENLDAGKCFGGIARRQSKILELRRANENTLLVDAGDPYQGTIWFYMYKGNATAHFMNLLGYQAMCLGNHEFDNGVPGLLPLLNNVNFTVVSANMDASQEPSIKGKFKTHSVIEVGGERIGIIGYILKDVPLITSTGKLTFKDEIESIQPIVDTLIADGVNKIIALGHAGYKRDIEIAKAVRGLDIVVGGHSHTFLYSGDPPTKDKVMGLYPTVVTQDSGRKVLVVQDYWFGKYLGLLHVNFTTEGEIESWTGNPILMDNMVLEDPAILGQLRQWHESITDLSRQVVGTSKVYLNGERETCRIKECNMGNLLAEAMVWNGVTKSANPRGDTWSNVAIGIMNSGGIRAPIDSGNISFEEVQDVQPFRNMIDIVDIDGANLMQILEHAVRKYDVEDPSGAFLQFSGIHVIYDVSRAPGNRVVDVRIRCADCLVPRYEPVNNTKIYSLITNEFTLNGGDGFKFNIRRRWNIGALDLDVTTNYLEKFSPLICDEEERIKFYEPKTMHPKTTSTNMGSPPVTPVYTMCILILSFVEIFVTL